MCVCESDCPTLQEVDNHHSTSLFHLRDQTPSWWSAFPYNLTFSLTSQSLSSSLAFPLSLVSQRSLMISSRMMVPLLQGPLANLPHLEGFSSFAVLPMLFLPSVFHFSFALLWCSHTSLTPLTHSKPSSQWARNYWGWTRNIKQCVPWFCQKKHSGVVRDPGSGAKAPGFKPPLGYLLAA